VGQMSDVSTIYAILSGFVWLKLAYNKQKM
jgi:hypothetical protein